MKFKLNCSPHLRMPEITQKLFNNNFLSDIQFSVDGNIIYAHSLELMKRSVIFEKQLEDTLGEKKIITINNCTYESFLEFIRFIYTDECEINDRNGIDLLKLATKYKVISLENRLINLLKSTEWFLELFEHCVTEKYEMARYRSRCEISRQFSMYVNHKRFLSLHPDAVNAFLKIKKVTAVTEIQIFNALTKWFDTYCENNKISLAEGRQKFDQFIRQIRFPTMTNNEIRDCAKNNPALLSESDCMSMAKQILFGADTGWISKQRCGYVSNRQWCKFKREMAFVTKLSVSKDTILHGFWIGIEKNGKEIEIKMTQTKINTKETETIQFTQSAGCLNRLLICLGESIRIRANFEYSITITYLDLADEYAKVWCRINDKPLTYNNPENSIQTLNASDNMLEMIFKLAPE